MSSATLKPRSIGAMIGDAFARSEDNAGTERSVVAMDGSSSDIICESGTSVVNGKRLYHDAEQRPPRMRQSGEGQTTLQTQGFDGSYISIVADLARADADRIAAGVDLVVGIEVEAEPALPVYFRAHFSNEEGREILHDLIVVEAGPRTVRFNLDGLRIPLDLTTSAWVDIIFSEPADANLSVTKVSVGIEEQ